MKNLKTLVAMLVFIQVSTSIYAQENESLLVEQFNKVSKTFQSAYMNANCEVLLPYLDQKLVIFENGEDWPYAKLIEYCPQLPVKPVIKTDRSYKILSDTLVYEFVSQTYNSKSGNTINETQAIIWEYKNDIWKIINYDVSRYIIKPE